MIARMKTVPSSVVSKPAARSSSAFEILMPVDELHRDDSLPGQVVVDGRDVDLGEALHAVRQPPGVIGLVAVVELLEDARGELGDDVPEADLAGDEQAPLGHAGEFLDDAQVGLRLGQDPRSLDLDRDDRAIEQGRAMDLRGGRRGERLVLERRVQDLGIRPQFLRDDRLRRRPSRTAPRRSGAWPARRSSQAAGGRSGWPSSGRSSRTSGRAAGASPDPRRAARIDELVGLAEDDAANHCVSARAGYRPGRCPRPWSRSRCRPAGGAGSRGSCSAAASAATRGIPTSAVSVRTRSGPVQAEDDVRDGGSSV